MIKFTAPEDRVVHLTNLKVTDEVTDRERNILTLLQEDPSYSYQELAKKIGVSRKTIAEKIKALKQKAIIERVGTTKNGYWKIKE